MTATVSLHSETRAAMMAVDEDAEDDEAEDEDDDARTGEQTL